MQFVQNYSQIQIVSSVIFLIICGAHMNILLNTIVKILFLNKWLYGSLQLCGLLNLEQ